MICPACGTDNPAERRFCARCAGLLQVSVATVDTAPPTSFDVWVAELADENLIDPVDSRFGLDETAPDAELWTPESVFVPASDEIADEPVVLEERDTTGPEFEDAHADDYFEQSLSGLKLSDAAISVEESVDEPDPISKPESFPEPEVDPELQIDPRPPVVHESVPEPGSDVIDDLEIDPRPEIVLESEIEPEPPVVLHAAVRRRTWARKLFKIAAALLASVLFFAAGLATGFWMLGARGSQIPSLSETPVVVEEKPQIPKPPPGMAFVPGGEFVMGSDTGDVLSRPAHRVTVAPYFIDVTEVTNEAYSEFVNATGHIPPSKWENGTFLAGEGTFPVTGVTWYDAVEYAAWAGKRLPTESEWEFAARGTEDRIYPWGNDWDPTSANVGKVASGVRGVGEGRRSPFGLFDMTGNAWEWTKSDAKSYPGGKVVPWSRLRLKVIRGGNWQSGEKTATTTFRGYYGAIGEREYNGTGFRCVRDIPRD